MNAELFPDIARPAARVLGDIFRHELANVVLGDCRNLLATLPDCCLDASVQDPPYELGFMGKDWDRSGIAYSVPFWREVLRVLRPGAYLTAFSHPTTVHRMTCAIEDAGFIIMDQLDWFYGSGFPKNLNLGNGRGTALKGSKEPIVLAMRPLQGTYEENLAKWGTGALNIDACRLGGVDTRSPKNGTTPGYNHKAGVVCGSELGRWPPNVILDEEAAAMLDEQSGPRGANSQVKGTEPSSASTGIVTNLRKRVKGAFHADTGGASRFFYCPKTSPTERDLGCEHLEPKTGGEATDREEDSAGTKSPRAGAGRGGGHRNFHPTVKPIALMRWLVRLVTPPGGMVLDPFTGSGSTGVASWLEQRQFLGAELTAEYAPIIAGRMQAAIDGRFN